VTKQQVVKSFEELSALKLGHVTLSRGRVNAIEWDYDPRMVGKVGLGLAYDFREPKVVKRILMHRVEVKRKEAQVGSIIIKNGPISIEVPSDTPYDRIESIINSVKENI
jgi:hypothetical protein